MKTITFLIFLAPVYAHAMDTGSWSKDSAGGVLKIGNQIMTSQRLTAPNESPHALLLFYAYRPTIVVLASPVFP